MLWVDPFREQRAAVGGVQALVDFAGGVRGLPLFGPSYRET
jgi:hypothetical protein